MQEADAMAEFIFLWDQIQQVQFQEQEDTLRWKWTSNGIYTASSAYAIQFQGSVCSYDAKAIWNARAEGKQKFFTWLAVQNKVLTANNLIKRGWPRNEICSLCDQAEETITHLCLHCPFVKEVWHLINLWQQQEVYAMTGIEVELRIGGMTNLRLATWKGRESWRQSSCSRSGTFGRNGIEGFSNSSSLHREWC